MLSVVNLLLSIAAIALAIQIFCQRYHPNPLHVLKEKMLMKFVWMLPRRVVYWCAIRVAAHATTGKYADEVVPDIPFMEALKRWDNR